MQVSCIFPPPEEGVAYTSLCIAYLHHKQLVLEATWRRARELVFSHTYGSQMHWKSDETAWCYRAHVALTCHWRRSMDRAAQPNNLVQQTDQTNLTSAAPAQRPQQLRCWEKMKTLMFSRTSKHRARDCLRDTVDVTASERGENEGQRTCWGWKL